MSDFNYPAELSFHHERFIANQMKWAEEESKAKGFPLTEFQRELLLRCIVSTITHTESNVLRFGGDNIF